MTPEQLKASILQYAIQGKLVEQRAEEGTGEELFQEIERKREVLIKEKIIKKDKRTNSIINFQEVPFDIPENWMWVTLGSILNKLTDGTHKTPKYTSTGVKFVSVKDMSNGFLSLENTKYISEEEHKELYARCNPEKGDLILSKVGTTGVPAIVDTTEPFSLFVSVALLKFDCKCPLRRYISLRFFQARARRKVCYQNRTAFSFVFGLLRGVIVLAHKLKALAVHVHALGDAPRLFRVVKRVVAPPCLKRSHADIVV